jgi:hypothetical protein
MRVTCWRCQLLEGSVFFMHLSGKAISILRVVSRLLLTPDLAQNCAVAANTLLSRTRYVCKVDHVLRMDTT